MSTAVLLPLCLLRNLSSLAPCSVLGLTGTLYAAAFMILRYFDGSYTEGGRFFSELVHRPSFNVQGGDFANIFTIMLLCTLSSSFIAHFNAPRMYAELQNASPDRFNIVVRNGYLVAFCVFSLFMVTGFLTFGGSTLGFVLNNYSGTDHLASISRLATGLALVTGYPFMFSALKEGVLDLSNLSGSARQNALTPTSIALLAIITSLALILKDVGLVVSLTGAIFGNAIMFIIPSIMYLGTIHAARKRYDNKVSVIKGSSVEVVANYGMIGVGVIMSILGITVNVLRLLNKL